MELENQVIEVQPPIAEGQSAPQETLKEVSPESEAQTEATQEKKPAADPVQKRINQLTWKAHEAERRANAAILAQQEAENRAQALWQQQQELMRQATMPRLDQHQDPQAYERAVQAHNQRFLEQQSQAHAQAFQRQQQAIAQQQVMSMVQAKIAEGSAKFADYSEVVNNPQLPPLAQVNPPLFAAILEHEQMPELTYYLGKNPGEAHRIAALPPARAILEMGKIAAKLPANQPRQTSNAPAPPAQVGGGSGSTKDPSRMSYDEFVAYRRKQIAARR